MESGYQKTILSNGIRVVSEKIPRIRSISIGIWIDVGSRGEEPHQGGISHFIEHMVFKGTEQRTAKQIAQELESVGGQLNAFTSKAQTCYLARVLDEHLPLAIDILSDLLLHPRFDPEEVAKERDVIIQEIKDIEDSPTDLIHDRFQSLIWDDHPLGRPISGSIESVSRLRREDLKEFMDKCYVTSNVVVAAAGNLNHNKLVKLVEKFLHIPSAEFEASSSPPLAPTQRVRVEHKSIGQVHLCLGRQAYSFHDPKRHAIIALDNLLGEGMSSILFQKVREERGLAYLVYSFLDFFQDTGLFGIYLGTSPPMAREALRLVMEELGRLVSEGVTSEELARAKEKLKGHLLLDMESTTNQMTRLAKLELFLGRYVSLDETVGMIDAVTGEEVQEVIEELFVPENLYLAVLGSTEEKFSIEELK